MSKKDRCRINGRTAVVVVAVLKHTNAGTDYVSGPPRKSPSRCCWRASSAVAGEEWRLRDGDKEKRGNGHEIICSSSISKIHPFIHSVLVIHSFFRSVVNSWVEIQESGVCSSVFSNVGRFGIDLSPILRKKKRWNGTSKNVFALKLVSQIP